jgi:hypothetical protein
MAISSAVFNDRIRAGLIKERTAPVSEVFDGLGVTGVHTA